jgi:hypothetical protein
VLPSLVDPALLAAPVICAPEPLPPVVEAVEVEAVVLLVPSERLLELDRKFEEPPAADGPLCDEHAINPTADVQARSKRVRIRVTLRRSVASSLQRE